MADDSITGLRQAFDACYAPSGEPIATADRLDAFCRTAIPALPFLLDEITVGRLLIDHLTQTPPQDGWTVEETNQWHTRRRALLEAHGIAKAANTKETP